MHRDISISNILIQQSPPLSAITEAMIEDSNWIKENLLPVGTYHYLFSSRINTECLYWRATAELSEFYSTMSSRPEFQENYMDTARRIELLRTSAVKFSGVIRRGLLNDLDYAGYTLGYSLTREYVEEVLPYESDLFTARTVREHVFVLLELVTWIILGHIAIHAYTGLDRVQRR